MPHKAGRDRPVRPGAARIDCGQDGPTNTSIGLGAARRDHLLPLGQIGNEGPPEGFRCAAYGGRALIEDDLFHCGLVED